MQFRMFYSSWLHGITHVLAAAADDAPHHVARHLHGGAQAHVVVPREPFLLQLLKHVEVRLQWRRGAILGRSPSGQVLI